MTTFATFLKRVIVGFTMIALFSCALCGCNTGADESSDVTTIKVAIAMHEDDFRCDYIRQFAADVEEGTGGRVKCEIFYQDTYNDQLTIYEGLKKGKVDVSLIAAPYFTDLVPEEGITGLPYLFSDHETAWEFAESDINKAVDEKLEKKGFKVIAHYCGSFRCLSNSKRPITVPDDMKGLIIGTVRSKTLLDMFSLFGATAYDYVSSELYDNLNRRTYDGADWSVSTFYTKEYYKIQPYVSVTNHAYNLWNMVIRPEVYEKLSDGDKAVLEEAARASSEGEREAVHKFENDIFNKLKELGIQVDYPDLIPFVDATVTIREKYSGDFKDVYEKTKEWIANR